jgi:hypothetical protein
LSAPAVTSFMMFLQSPNPLGLRREIPVLHPGMRKMSLQAFMA